ncbi:hypothetical protein SPRA44_280085 [Serratia proteamaculans]|nr:hypothetical protein SPRA44_280085 [Serratia proteamaculans]
MRHRINTQRDHVLQRHHENHCQPQRVPDLLKQDLNGSLTEIYQQHYALIYRI